MDRLPLKVPHFSSGRSQVGIILMAIVFLVDRSVANELSLGEACTKLRSHSADLELQGITSDGSAFTLVANNQTFIIPQSEDYLRSENIKFALYSRGSTQIVEKGNILTNGFFTNFDNTFPTRNLQYYSLLLVHLLPCEHDKMIDYYSIFRKTTDLAPDAANWTFVVSHGIVTSLKSPSYGYVSDSQPGLNRSFTLRPLKPTDPESKIVMSPGNIVAYRFKDTPYNGEVWYYLDFDAHSATLTISPVLNEQSDGLGKSSYQSLVAKLPMLGFIYGDKVHLWDTNLGQVLVYDYVDLATSGGNASVKVSAYSFEQYFACNEDQWNSISQTAQPLLGDAQGSVNGKSGFLGIILGFLAVLVIAIVGFFLFKLRGGHSKIKSGISKSNLAIGGVKPLDRAKSSTKNAFKMIGSMAKGKTVATGKGSMSGASSAQSSAASTLSKATDSSASSSMSSSTSSRAESNAASTLSKVTGSSVYPPASSSRGGASNAGSSISTTAGSTLSAASSVKGNSSSLSKRGHI